MMKKAFVIQVSLCLSVLFLVTACSKDNSSPVLPSQTFPLYNHSSGSPKPAGSFTLFQLQGGGVSINMQLAADYLVPGSSLDAFLTTCDTCVLIYSTLGTVNGNSGIGSTGPVKTNGNNETVPFDSLITKKGYAVKILNGSNVQAVGTIR